MLNRTHRFHGLGSLNLAYRQGQTVRAPMVSLKFVRNQRRSTYRVAVVVSRKVHKSAVARNRIRRRVYQAFQSGAGQVQAPYDLVFTVFDEQLASLPFAELENRVASLLQKAGIATGGNDRLAAGK